MTLVFSPAKKKAKALPGLLGQRMVMKGLIVMVMLGSVLHIALGEADLFEASLIKKRGQDNQD